MPTIVGKKKYAPSLKASAHGQENFVKEKTGG
jgi:hypothetical protein